MFDELSGEGWLIVVAALILGFGVVRWMIATVEKSKDIPKSPGTQSSQSEHDRDEGSSSHQQSKKSAWQEPWQTDSTVLGVTPVASIDEIRAAYKRKMSQ